MLGTCGRHCWALVGGTAGHLWAALLGTCGWHCWAPIIRALIISALMIGANPSSDNCRLLAVLSSCCDNLIMW
ncbi:unnamed protein product [Staurois parvus]|uniref:Secreted protein n=1 Tax=Staurois parvus TaxID=386267 RepID=A0ABN9GCQ0_9NEOB|nr:unnamed protein product [Staurois parvus]